MLAFARHRDRYGTAPVGQLDQGRTDTAGCTRYEDRVSGHDISIDSTVMAVTVGESDPDRVYCVARLGQVFGTEDGGASWTALPLPEGVQDVRAVVCI